MPLLHRSISDIPEREAITHVLNDVHDRDLIMNIKGIDSKGALLDAVELPRARGCATGDVDILVVPPAAPDQTTAIQVKRLPVRVDENGRADPRTNYFEELFRTGAEQANRNARLGFYQVYLWLFVLLDTRAANRGRLTYEGANPELHACIEDAISLQWLDPRVGLIKFEWVQPMDTAPFECCTGGGSLERLASPASQPAKLTEWIKEQRRLIV